MIPYIDFNITSLWFFVFLFFALMIYYLAPRKWQWPVMLITSLAFIFLAVGFGALPFMLIAVLVPYFGARLIQKTKTPRQGRWILAVAILLLIAQLFLLKYYNNMLSWINKGSQWTFEAMLSKVFGMNAALVAPVGISYFTLSAIGYMMDVYWGSYAPQRNVLKFSLFVLWFPRLVSGPFVQYSQQEAELFTSRPFDYQKVKFGMERLLWGVFKKLVLADTLAIYTKAVFGNTVEYQGFYIAVGIIFYAFQIYMDFSGCMDMVLGISEMFQVTMPENFRRPFFSHTMSEFWRRWHITLGEWSKDYILYPLQKSGLFVRMTASCKKVFGNKTGKRIPTYLALAILWAIIGLWHGGTARYFFAAGVLPWFILVFGQILKPFFSQITKRFKIKTDCFSYQLFGSIRTFVLMCLIWFFPVSNSLADGFLSIRRMFAIYNPWVLFDGSLLNLGLARIQYSMLFAGLLTVLVVGILQERGLKLRETLEEQNLLFQWFVLLTGLFAVIICGIYGPGYSVGEFIYGGF